MNLLNHQEELHFELSSDFLITQYYCENPENRQEIAGKSVNEKQNSLTWQLKIQTRAKKHC